MGMVEPGRRGWTWVAALVSMGVLALGGCSREPTYSQASPDDVIASAQAMIRNNDAEKLHQLIYADDIYMRGFLVRLGNLMGHLQELTTDLNAKFPEDIKKLEAEAQARAAAAARQGRLSGVGAFFGQLASSGRGRAPGGPTTGAQREDAFRDTITQVFADPYSWLVAGAERISTVRIDDERVAVMWDKKPMPPFGMVMEKKADGKWYVLLPVNVPVLNRYVPRSKSEWSMFASLVKVFDNAVIELRDEVRNGQIRSFADVSRKAGEKIFVPAGLAALAIGRHYETKFAADRRAREASRNAAGGNPAAGAGTGSEGQSSGAGGGGSR
jgi:hypothetical protein